MALMCAESSRVPLKPRWHEALAYAVTGAEVPGLGRQARPDVVALAEVLLAEPGRDPGGTQRPAATTARHVVTRELLAGIGAAQFWAVLADLQRELARHAPAERSPVTQSRALTAEERRLLADVPPHHGH